MKEKNSQVLAKPWAIGRLWEKTKLILEMVKFPHTIFALPMALMAAFLAAGGWPAWEKLGLITLAMIGARNGAMAFNRLVDAKFDAQNPRTRNRALPAGTISAPQVIIFVIVCSALFFFSAYLLGPLAFALSPVALGLIFGYSFTKRFTPFSHIVLGLCLGLAPVGAWVGIRNKIELLPLLITLATLLWVAGFDIIYACTDVEFDRRVGLHSIPKHFGLRGGLFISAVLHVFMFGVLLWIMYLGQLGLIYGIGLVIVGGLLIWQHMIVKPHDLSRADQAFFTVNGFISIIIFLFTAGDILWFKG
jgi:4-hydroxybenzoate polyprenyltransferase